MTRVPDRIPGHPAAVAMVAAAILAFLLAGCATQPVRPGAAAAYTTDTVTAPTGERDGRSDSAAASGNSVLGAAAPGGDARGGTAPTGGSGAASRTGGKGKAAAPGTPPGGGAGQPGTPAAGRSAAGKAGGAAGTDSAGARGPADTGTAGSIRVEAAPSPAPPRAEPLIMENADRMEGFRSRGEYVLSGKVRFTHGALRLETERAVWLKDRSIVYAESGMRIIHRGAVLTSDKGSYDKNLGRATAEGRVRMRDSSGEVEAEGDAVAYLRFRHEATLTGNPVVRRFYRKPPDSAGTAKPPANPPGRLSGKAAGPAAGKPAAPAAGTAAAPGAAPGAGPGPVTDTLAIRGKVLTYNDSARVATAEGSVNITRKQVNITCKRAEYHDRTDSLYLTGEPAVKVDESRITGLSMRVGMDGEEIRSLLVKGDAKAKSVEAATDTSSARESDISGDSLFLAFREKAIDSMQVFRNAKGSYFEKDKPAYVNRMSGEYMVLRFAEKKINSANVLGGAKSTYFHVEKKTFKGRNEAEGDTIDFAFKDGKVEEVMVRGRAKGTYFGTPSPRKGGPDSASAPEPGGAPADSSAPGRAPGAGVPGPGPKAAGEAALGVLGPDGEAVGKAAAPAPGAAPAGAAGAAGAAEPDRTAPPNPWRRK